MKKTILATLITGLLLTGCDADPQDSSTTGMSTTISGKVIDPYIVGSKVYADVNNNGQHDVFEDIVFTDINGEFSLPVANDGQKVILRTLSGFDKTSVQENLASMSVEIDPNAAQQANITPLSSLLHHLDDSGRVNLATLLNVPSDELDTLSQDDFVADFTAGTNTDGLVKNLAIHKPISVLTAKLEALYDEDKFDDVDELPDDFGSVVYDEFAKALQGSSDLDTVLSTTLNRAELELRDIVIQDAPQITPPPALLNPSEISSQAKQISELVADITASQTLTGSENELYGLVRAVDIVNAKIVQGGGATAIGQAIAVAKDSSDRAYFDSLAVTETININAAINADDVVNADIAVNNDDKFNYQFGFGLRFTEAENSSQEDTIVQLYFQPGGKLTICAKVTLDEEDMDDFNVDTSGFILDGSYTKLDDISILNVFTILGNDLNPVITLAGSNIDGSNKYSISLDSEGLDEDLDGVKFTLPNTIPYSDSSCKDELNDFSS